MNQQQQPQQFNHSSFTGKVGVARVDITPPIGIYCRNWGAAKHDVAAAIHRPLTLSALVLTAADDNGADVKKQLVLTDADAGWWKTPGTSRRFQARLLEELSLDPSAFIFAVTHSHAAPPLMDPDPTLPGSELTGPWMEKVYQATVEAIRQAWDNQFEATLDWHTGRCGLAQERDLPDPDAAAALADDRFICGFNPQGEPDDTLLLGRVADRSGALRAVLVNYACHPTTLAWDNTAISPDFVGAMRQTIEDDTGAKALFMQGASGELAPRYQYVGDTEVADRHGRQLGYAALATLNDMEPPATGLAFQRTVESGAPLAVWSHEPRDLCSELRAIQTTVDLPLKDWPSADELERQRVACTDRALQERLQRKLNVRRAVGDDDTLSLPIWVWRIGDAVLVGSCCEPYSLFQQELRRRFPERAVVCMNLINGSLGYLPPTDRYDVNIYQVWQTPFDRGCLEKTIEVMSATIGEIIADHE
jgi:hypothetical protein